MSEKMISTPPVEWTTIVVEKKSVNRVNVYYTCIHSLVTLIGTLVPLLMHAHLMKRSNRTHCYKWKSLGRNILWKQWNPIIQNFTLFNFNKDVIFSVYFSYQVNPFTMDRKWIVFIPYTEICMPLGSNHQIQFIIGTGKATEVKFFPAGSKH